MVALSIGSVSLFANSVDVLEDIAVGLTVEETVATRDRLLDVDGLAVTNSLVGVCPVTRLNGEALPLSPQLAALKP